MKKFEQQLFSALQRHGWSLDETSELRDLWWASRAWRIRSIRDNFGYELHLTFIGHYQSGNEVGSADPIESIVASEHVPIDLPSTINLPEISVDAQDYPERVVSFVTELNAWRAGSSTLESTRTDAASPDGSDVRV